MSQKRRKTDTQSDVKDSTDELFINQSKLTGVYVKKNLCFCQFIYDFAMNVEVKRKSGDFGCFEHFFHLMVYKAPTLLDKLMWNMLQ